VHDTATFTWGGLWRGIVMSLPLGASSILFGLAFGALASGAGLTVAESVLMSAAVFSGTAQLAILQMGVSSLAVLPIFATVLAVNARYILMGAALRPWLGPLPFGKSAFSLFFLVDQSFALAMRERMAGDRDAALFLGSGLVSYITWVAATGGGYLLGQSIGDPKVYGVDFILVAFCAASTVMIWRGREQLLVLVGALAAAVAVERYVGGAWAVVAAGLTAALIGALQHGRAR
jgi:predicted branched-subunit amino acid permease